MKPLRGLPAIAKARTPKLRRCSRRSSPGRRAWGRGDGEGLGDSHAKALFEALKAPVPGGRLMLYLLYERLADNHYIPVLTCCATSRSVPACH